MSFKKSICIIMFSCLYAFIYSQTILIFNTQEFEPFIYSQNNHPVGPGAEILELVCKNSGISYKLNIYPWTRAMAEVEEGKANGLFFLAKSKEREAWLDFSTPIIATEYGFFVLNEDKTKYSSDFQEMTNKTIGVYGPSNTSTSLESFAKTVSIKIDKSVDDEAAFKKLSAGRFEAVYSNKDVGLAIIKKLNLKNIHYAGKHKDLVYYFALSKKTDQTQKEKFFNELTTIKNNGGLSKILTKHNIQTAK